MVPTYASKEANSNRFVEFFKGTVYTSLDGMELTKRGLAGAFEQLLFVHAYVHTLFETGSQDNFESVIQEALPPLFTLDNILRKCADLA